MGERRIFIDDKPGYGGGSTCLISLANDLCKSGYEIMLIAAKKQACSIHSEILKYWPGRLSACYRIRKVFVCWHRMHTTKWHTPSDRKTPSKNTFDAWQSRKTPAPGAKQAKTPVENRRKRPEIPLLYSIVRKKWQRQKQSRRCFFLFAAERRWFQTRWRWFRQATDGSGKGAGKENSFTWHLDIFTRHLELA